MLYYFQVYNEVIHMCIYIYIYIDIDIYDVYIFFFRFFSITHLLQDTEYGSLWYTLGSLFILYMVMYIC